jgi:hypothetical protein
MYVAELALVFSGEPTENTLAVGAVVGKGDELP